MPPPITTTGPAPVALEDVVLAWPGALDHLKPRLKAMARESRPIRVDGVAVVLGLPPRYSAVHLPTIAAEAATVAQALSAELGRAVRVRVETADITAPAEGPEGAYDETDVILPPGLGPGVGAGLDSPVALVIETFGATIESESVRDQ